MYGHKDIFEILHSKNEFLYDYTKLVELVLIHIEFSLTFTLHAHCQVLHNQEVDQ